MDNINRERDHNKIQSQITSTLQYPAESLSRNVSRFSRINFTRRSMNSVSPNLGTIEETIAANSNNFNVGNNLRRSNFHNIINQNESSIESLPISNPADIQELQAQNNSGDFEDQ
mmetsp:Transcript_4689/g.3946  ORF Transcript_4689/g.3946 Transcript_4689/m.3946 type:complete len:115 (-) Transcript_4689:49-393(-)